MVWDYPGPVSPLKALLPGMLTVIADTDNNRLIIDSLAVRPLGIF